MNRGACPDRPSLELLLLGRLDAADSARWEDHLLQCDRCAAAACQVAASDELTAALHARPTAYGDEETVAQVIERGLQLCSKAETVHSADTLAAAPKESAAGGEPDFQTAANADDELLDFLAPPQRPDEIGRLGEYRVLEVLGAGGMGIVFRAEDPKLARQVALKAMKPSIAARRSAKERFLREARATAAIEHDHIVTIHQVGEDRGVPFIAMQYLRGESLHARLQREGQLPQQEGVRIGREVAAGLAAAHARGLIHRDIKPDNIWLDETTGRAKILDFGLVRATDDDAGLTQSNVVLGTPRYMAPEQAQGQAVDHRCDLFSLGCVLYHLLAGRAPFSGANVTATLIAVVQHDPAPVEKLRPDVHPDLAQLIGRLLAKDRAARPQSAAEVAATLAEIERNLSAPQSIAPPLATTIEHAPVIVAAAARRSARPNVRRRRALIGGGVGLLAVGILFALWAAGVLFKVETEHGTLVVRFDGERGGDFATTVQGKIVKIRNTQTGADYTIHLNQPATSKPGLAPGVYEFVLETDSGLRTETDRFTIDGDNLDEPAVVEVWWEPKDVPVATTAATWHVWPSDAPAPAIAPFDAAQARAHQEAWAAHLGVPVEYENSIGMKFVLIPPGEFTMGSTPEEIEAVLVVAGADGYWKEHIRTEAPQHKVILTSPIYLGVYEVTQTQYEQVMGQNPSHFAATGHEKDRVVGLDTSTHPVELVSWNDAAEFCAKLSEIEKLKPFYFRSGETVAILEGTGYRLPTEAEWEFACRAGTTTKYWTGDRDEDLPLAGWFIVNSGGRTHAVGELQANPLGLFDIHGNVWEWLQDGWEPTYYAQFQDKPALNPSGPVSASSLRGLRGGDWNNVASLCRASQRFTFGPTTRGSIIGFRVALSIDAIRQAVASPRD